MNITKIQVFWYY